jgi:L-alanine-DL-glutamate epimerase-like enolase superfamily enzyme
MDRRQFIQVFSATPGAVLISRMGDDRPGSNRDEKELGAHRISRIVSRPLSLRYPRLVGKNSRRDVHGYGPDLNVYEIITDKGASGWGIVTNSKSLSDHIDGLVGKSVAEVFSPAIGVTQEIAMPFDIALHDLAGIVLQKPVYELMGVSKPIITKCYSGMIYLDDLDPPERPRGIDAIMKDCEWDYKYGYRQFKIKIGRGGKWMEQKKGTERDIEITKMVANAYPDCDILVDGNDMFTIDTFLSYLEGIRDVKLFWIEEPFVENVHDYRILKNWLTENGKQTLLADGEANSNLPLALELGSEKLLDVYLQDIIGLGFTNWRKLNPDLRRKGIQSSPHNWGELLKTYYTAHLIGAQGNAPTIEGVTCFSDDVDFGAYQLENGSLIPSPAPGFGMKLVTK